MGTTVTLNPSPQNVTCSSVASDQLKTLLDSRNAADSIHVTVFLSVFCALGTVGNFLTVLVSARRREKSSATIFVLTLAVVDFVVCAVVVPLTLYEVNHVTLTGQFWCRVNPYLTAASLLTGTLVLLAAAVDRFRAVCRPVQHFSTRKSAVAAAGVCVVLLGCAAAVPAIFIHGQVSGFTAQAQSACHPISLCYTLNQEMSRMYYGIMAAVFLSSVVVMGVLYTLVYKYVRDLVQADTPVAPSSGHRAAFSSLKFGAKRARVSSLPDSTAECPRQEPDREEAEVPAANRASLSRLATRRLTLQLNLPVRRPSLPPSAVQHHYRVAKLFLLVTAAFLAAWLPYWVVSLRGVVAGAAPPVLQGGTVETRAGEFFRHLHFASNAANPVIYAFCHRTFRERVLRVVTCQR